MLHPSCRTMLSLSHLIIFAPHIFFLYGNRSKEGFINSCFIIFSEQNNRKRSSAEIDSLKDDLKLTAMELETVQEENADLLYKLKSKMCFGAFSWIFCLKVKYSQIYVAAGLYYALLKLCLITFLAPNTENTYRPI